MPAAARKKIKKRINIFFLLSFAIVNIQSIATKKLVERASNIDTVVIEGRR